MNPINTPEGAAAYSSAANQGFRQLDSPSAQTGTIPVPIPVGAQAAILYAVTDLEYRFSPPADYSAAMVLGAGMALPLYGDMLTRLSIGFPGTTVSFRIQFFAGIGLLPTPSGALVQAP